MPQYDSSFAPPAPILDIRAQNPDLPDREVSVSAQLDTAADLSGVPFTLVSALGLARGDVTTIAGYDGKPNRTVVYLVNLEVSGYRFEQVRCIPIPDSVFLLGRNVLNQLNITLRGKDQAFELGDP